MYNVHCVIYNVYTETVVQQPTNLLQGLPILDWKIGQGGEIE